MPVKNRREFLKTSAAGICTAGLTGMTFTAGTTAAAASRVSAKPDAPSIKKGLVMSMLPEKLSVSDRFKLARDTGFELIQAPTTPEARQADEIKAAADASGVRVDSVMNMAHWKYPLSSADPAVVNPQTSYKDAWTRSQKQIRALLPLAEELQVVIAIEEVWNKFLLSPLEMLAYINELKHPLVRVWFDVGNVVLYGYPQDWIHTLGPTIAKVHLKDFKRSENGYAWVNLGDGDIDWPAVRQAFTDVGYHGSAIAELQPGDEAYLRDVSKRIDRLLLGRS